MVTRAARCLAVLGLVGLATAVTGARAGQTIYLDSTMIQNVSPTGGTQVGARFKLDRGGGWDQGLYSSGPITPSNLVDKDLINGVSAPIAVSYDFTFSYNKATGYTFSLTNGSRTPSGSLVTNSTLYWDNAAGGTSATNLFVENGGNPDPTTLTYNALHIEMFANSTNPTNSQSVEVKDLAFTTTDPNATLINPLNPDATTYTSPTANTGTGQWIVSTGDLGALSNWSLTAKVKLSLLAGTVSSERLKFEVNGKNVEYSVVPEPSTIASAGFAGVVLGLAALRRRRRQARST